MTGKSMLTTIRNHTIYLPAIRKNGVVLDLGAHKGEFSIAMSKKFGSSCYLIEANPELFDQIQVTENNQKFNYAISGEDKPIQFFIGDNAEASSIKKTSDNINEVVTIDGIRLDTFISRCGLNQIDLLKMDIEGAEFDLFNTIDEKTLLSIRQITVEFHDWVLGNYSEVVSLRKRLKKLGFVSVKFTRKNTDVLFINTNHVEISFFTILMMKMIAVPRWIKLVFDSRMKK